MDIKYRGAVVVKGTKPGGGTRTFDGVAINDLRSPPNIFNYSARHSFRMGCDRSL